MSIFPSGGVLSVGAFTQPAIAPTANCVRFYGDCLTAIDLDAFNSQIKEQLNLTDAAGIPWDCGSNENLVNAVCAIATQKACAEIAARVEPIYAQNSYTLPAGGSWAISITENGTDDTVGPAPGNNLNSFEIDDDDDQIVGGNSGIFAGGTTFSSDAGHDTVLTGFAVRVDC